MSVDPVPVQAEDILRELRERPDIALAADVDTEDLEELIDPEKPRPVNLRRIVEAIAADGHL